MQRLESRPECVLNARWVTMGGTVEDHDAFVMGVVEARCFGVESTCGGMPT